MKENWCFWIALTIALIFGRNMQAQWTEIHDLGGKAIHDFAVSDSGIWLASSDGIYYLSEDFKTLEAYNNGLVNTYISDIDVFGYYLVAGTWEGVYLSKDMGRSWENVSSDSFASQNIRAVASNDSMLLTGINGGLYMTINSGRSWEDYSKGLSAYATFVLKDNGSGFYAATDGGVYRHSLAEGSWELINEEIIRDILISDENLVLGGDYGIFVSKDEGLSWELRMEGMENALVSSLSKAGASYFAGTQNSGVYQSKDLQSWEAWNKGLEETGITSLVAFRDTFLLCGTTSGKLALLDIHSGGANATRIPATGEENFKVWPNPAGDFVYVECGTLSGELQVELYASTGALLRKESMQGGGSLRIELPMQKGVYYLRLGGRKTGSIMRKIIRL